MSGCVQVEPQLKQSYGGPGGHVFHVLAKPHKTPDGCSNQITT